MPRATKIVATLGPASSDPAVLERLLRAGVDVVRLNFSHGTAQDHRDRATLVRETALRVGKPVALRHARNRAIQASSAWTTRSCRATSSPATTCCSTTG
jgi:Pyruvate kinase, barrel domain